MHDIKARKERRRINNIFEGRIIYDSLLVNALKKFNVPIQTIYDWYTETNEWDIGRKLEEKFCLKEYSLCITSRSIKLITTNLTQFEHKQIARLIYKDAQKKGFSVKHECETEITSENCLNN